MIPLQKQRFMSGDIQLESDSDSDEDQQQSQSIIKNAPETRHKSACCNIIKLILFIFLVAAAILYFFCSLGSKININCGVDDPAELGSKQQVLSLKNNQHFETNQNFKDWLESTQIQKSPDQQHLIKQQNSFKNKDIDGLSQSSQNLQLANLTPILQKQNTSFLANNLETGNMHWFKNREVRCIPDRIINSAAQLQANGLYSQQTAYHQINILAEKVSIPADNIYQWEGVRQFIVNITRIINNSIIAFDHPSTIVLIISAKYSKHGLFVSDRTNKQLLQQNLILNDVFPLANFASHDKILEGNGFHILITDSVQTIQEILIKKKKNIIILLQIVQPYLFDSSMLRKLKIYQFSNDQECNARQISLLESATWRIDEKSWLVVGWYVFLNEQQNLPQVYIYKNYEQNQLHKKIRYCSKPFDFQQEQYQMENGYILSHLPCQLLLLRQRNSTIDYTQLDEINIWLHNNVPNKPVLFSSGSFAYGLLIAAILPQNIPMIVASQYPEYKLLRKNLVLNNLQSSVIFQQMSQQNVNCDIIFTTDQQLQATFPQKAVYLFNSIS